LGGERVELLGERRDGVVGRYDHGDAVRPRSLGPVALGSHVSGHGAPLRDGGSSRPAAAKAGLGGRYRLETDPAATATARPGTMLWSMPGHPVHNHNTGL